MMTIALSQLKEREFRGFRECKGCHVFVRTREVVRIAIYDLNCVV